VYSRQLHIDTFLTGISVGYTNAEYIADEIFPMVPVQKQSDVIPTFTQSAWFRDEAQLRGVGSKSQGGGWSTDNTNTYFCNRYSYRHEIPDELRDNADAPWNLDLEAVEFATDKLMMNRERSFVANLFTTSKWGTDLVGNTDFTSWDDYANSSPLLDIYSASDTVESKIGREANTFVLGKQVWVKLKWHPDLVDTIKYTEKGIPAPSLLAEAAEVGRVLVGRAIYTSSPEGTAETSVTYSRIWGKHALMLYVPDHPSLMTPAAGYTFVWQRVAGAQQYIKRIRIDEREVDAVEANSYYHQKVTAKNAAVFMSGAVA
jgi:hypothetical protein